MSEDVIKKTELDIAEAISEIKKSIMSRGLIGIGFVQPNFPASYLGNGTFVGNTSNTVAAIAQCIGILADQLHDQEKIVILKRIEDFCLSLRNGKYEKFSDMKKRKT